MNDYLISLENVDLNKLLTTWTWLIGDDKKVVAVSKMGDAILRNDKNELFFLDVGGGQLEKISNNYTDFFENKLPADKFEEIILRNLVDNLEANNKKLKEGQVYSYTLLPILGGQYDLSNIFCLDVYEHFGVTGEIHFQIKDLPDGTYVEIKTD